MKILVLCLVLMSSISLARVGDEPLVLRVFKSYSSGNYHDAIKEIDQLIKFIPKWGTAYYWKATCLMKLNQFDESKKYFQLAKKYRAYPKTLHYDQGQLLYALNDLDEAQASFKEAAKRNVKIGQSYYYMADISFIMEDFDNAIPAYNKVLESADANVKLKQAAAMYKAKAVLRREEAKGEVPVEFIENEVLPLFDEARDMDEFTAIAKEIDSQKGRLMAKYKLDHYKNGRRILKKHYRLKVSQGFSYDSNVTLTPDDTGSSTETEQASSISTTSVSGRYRFDIKRRFTVAPGMKGDFEHHFNRVPEIYQNDNYKLNPFVKTTYEHRWGEIPTALEFDIDYTYHAKDYDQDEKKEEYSKTLGFSLGEKFVFFPIGDTTVKLKYKKYTGYIDAINSTTTTLNATQVFKLPQKHLVVGTFNLDETTAEVDVNSTRSYMLRGDYIAPEPIYWNVKWSAALSATFLDTKEQSDTRGMEKTFSPSVKLEKEVYQKTTASFKYDYSKKMSKGGGAYEYSKNVFLLEVEWSM